ncbi:MAG: glycosyltransferase family 2 protein [Oscillospiraceae bacterium]
MIPKLYIVVPCYNEEDVLPDTLKVMTQKIQTLSQSEKISTESRILFIDDGSKDNTWQMIENYSNENELVEGIKLSRNKGHQNAVLAGLMFAKDYCDIAVSIDADLQDDINAIDKMVEEYLNGCDIVYGVRGSRTTDTGFKRNTAQGYYKFMEALGVDIIYNHADFRLMSKRALVGLSEFKEANLFLRGIVPLIGFRYSTVSYDRTERMAGQSKYPFKKMMALAIDGITSFSIKPLRFITFLGAVICGFSIITMLTILILKIGFGKIAANGSLVCSIWLLSGVQLLGMGILGEYIGKIYQEVKHRPRYIIEKDTLNNEK